VRDALAARRLLRRTESVAAVWRLDVLAIGTDDHVKGCVASMTEKSADSLGSASQSDAPSLSKLLCPYAPMTSRGTAC
jgi:hypothetical protein